jgi:hypothetical protein
MSLIGYFTPLQLAQISVPRAPENETKRPKTVPILC